MSWYDLFSGFYDRSLEPLYRDQRRLAGGPTCRRSTPPPSSRRSDARARSIACMFFGERAFEHLWSLLAINYSRVELPSKKQHGGQLFLAHGDKPT
jgi:hypothetical protein